MFNFIFSVLNKTANTTKCNCAVILLQKRLSFFYSKLVAQTLIKVGFTNVTQNYFYKCYSELVSWGFLKMVPQVLPKIDPQMLFKIGSTSVTQNRPTNVTQNRPPNVT